MNQKRAAIGPDGRRRAAGLLLVAAAAALLATAGGALPAAETDADGLIASPEPGWPQWRGPRRDAISAETGLLAAWPEGGPRLLWKAENLGTGWASPIVVKDTVVITGDVGDDLVLYAFGVDGKPRWQAKNGQAWHGSFPGARACAAYSEGVLYHINAHGRLAALDAATGHERWAVEVLERFESKNVTWAITECLLVDGPRLIVTPAGPKTLMAALDKTTGRTAWASEPIPNETLSYCSPILFRQGGRRILTNCTSHHAAGVDADTGKLLWQVPFRNRHGVTCSTPVYGDGGVFYATPDGPNGVLYRIRVSGPEVRAELGWQSRVDTLTGSGVLVAGSLYTAGCKTSKSVHCIDWADGRTRYEANLTDGKGPYGSAAMVWADGRLYGLLDDGAVVLLKPGTDGFDVAGRFQLVQVKNRDAWAHPVLLDGRLYLRYRGTLWCYDVRTN